MTVALSVLRTRTRQRADQVQSNYVGDSEVDSYINEALRSVHYEMTCSGIFPEESSTDITATGAASYTLPELISILSVERVSGNTYVPMRRIEKPEASAMRSIASGTAILYDVSWSLRAAPSIRFFPKPGSGTYTVRYIPPVTALVADGDTVFAGSGWDQLIVVAAAISCVRRENGDTRGLEEERKELLVRLQREAQARDWTYPSRITPSYDDVSDSSEFSYSDRHGGSGAGYP